MSTWKSPARSMRVLALTASFCGVLMWITGCDVVPAPTGCTTDADCDDGDPCTTDTCSAGICANDAVEDCAPVEVSAAIDGDAVPGGSVIATATVDIRDGSTVSSYTWAQSNSVSATIAGADSATATVTLPGTDAYKDELLTFLASPPIGEDELPENVPLPEGEFPGGLQDRFHVVGLNPFALEEAGLVTLRVSVTTTSGTYTGTVDIHADLPWDRALGIRNVPIGVAVLLHGKTQDAYDWDLSAPSGSSASMVDGTTQNPYFTPDVDGMYRVSATNTTVEPSESVSLEIYAGTWEGAITGQDADGRPEADNCATCHNGEIAPDTFTTWAQTGHAEIFTNNLNTSTHYGEGCFDCHTVGFGPDAANGSIDEVGDYEDFLNAGLLNVPGDNWTQVLRDFPDTAQMANIQCENCHGPQNGSAHTQGAPRMSLASDVCAYCHGEPLRHARFQQWQLSGHANYELAIDEGESGNCSRCHTVNGFLNWLPILLDDDPDTDRLANIEVTWTADETHPQTCVTCHDPHDIGTTTGVDTDATIRISGDTPPLIAGFQVFGAGRGAICMTCHNSRRGLRNDDNFADSDTKSAARAPHGSAQTDVLMGENAYLVNVGVRGSHSLIEDACVNCHMVQTSPPDLLSYNLGGTNHTFFASPDICAKCHSELNADGVQTAFDASSDQLQVLVQNSLLDLIADLVAAGNTLTITADDVVAATVTDTADITEIEFGESHGRQGMTVTLADGTVVGPIRMSDVEVFEGTESVGALYDFADDRLVKAGWNWTLAYNDRSRGVHNPPFVFEFLDASIDALNELQAE